MARIFEICLPAGTRTIPLGKVPALLAQALFPEQPDGLYIFQRLTKEMGDSPCSPSPPCEGADLAFVNEIAGPPPPAGQPIGKDELKAFLTKFNESPLRKEWKIGASVINEKQSADINRIGAEDEHCKALKGAIRSGSVVPLSQARVPLDESIREALDLGQIFVETFRDYASKFDVLVRVERDSSHKNVTIETAARWLAGHTPNESVEAWFEAGRNSDIRKDIGAAMSETDIVGHALALAGGGKSASNRPCYRRASGRRIRARCNLGID